MRRRDFWSLTAPSMVVMFGLLLYPLYKTIQWSLQRVSYGQPGTFVGFNNYRGALTDPRFHKAVLFTVGLTLLVTAVVVVGGYLIAVLVNGLKRMRPVVLGALLVSYVIPQVVGATMFSWLFNNNFGGVLNYLLSSLTGKEIFWFTSTWPNRAMIAMNVCWSMLPFAMLIIMAGLQGVPNEMIEAAKIDGASTIKRHLYVIAPTIKGALGFVTLISIMDVIRTFDPLIPLAPQAVQTGNESIMLYVYNVAFNNGSQELGLGSAVDVLLIVLIVILLFPFIRNVWKETLSS